MTGLAYTHRYPGGVLLIQTHYCFLDGQTTAWLSNKSRCLLCTSAAPRQLLGPSLVQDDKEARGPVQVWWGKRRETSSRPSTSNHPLW